MSAIKFKCHEEINSHFNNQVISDDKKYEKGQKKCRVGVIASSASISVQILSNGPDSPNSPVLLSLVRRRRVWVILLD